MILAGIIVIIVAGVIIWRVSVKPEPAAVPSTATPEPQTLGGEIYNQVQNPGERLPETNVFEAAKNPFEKANTNPFKDVYKNPFSQ